MLMALGKVQKTKKELEACLVIDTNTKETKMVSVARLKQALSKGVRIKGIRLGKTTYYIRGYVQTGICREKGLFSFSKLPELNGYGELINEVDRNKLVVYAWQGFADAKQYHLLNYKGEEVVLGLEAFIEQLKAGNINGASYNEKTNTVNISDELNVEIV